MTASFDVIIVGAGPVGLSLAIELGGRGVRCLVVERSDRGYAPRAKLTNIRSRTHLRRWGVADALADASPLGLDYPSNVVFTTRLSGPRLARFEDAFNMFPDPNRLYPEHAQWVPQYTLEKVLRVHAQTMERVEFRFDTAFVEASQNASSVTATLLGTSGRGVEVEGRYLVGADGARSTVRETIGATLSGRSGLSRNHNIIFRAPGLAAAHAHGPAIMYWQINGDMPSILGPMDRDDIWYFGLTGIPEGVSLSDAEARASIARATGIDLPYEILSQDQWVASRLIADRYRDARIFLAGDACHLHPPFGGYGMNMGIGDGADLGWKLAAVLQGWGGESLLESYECERRPVHEWIMDEAEANHAILGSQLYRAGLEDQGEAGVALREAVGQQIREAKGREFHTLGAVLGVYYKGSPVLIEEEGEFALRAEHYTPSSRPGCLAPHFWLAENVSLYDIFGSGFTLLVRDRAAPAEARQEAMDAGIPLEVVDLPPDVPKALYPAPLTLVRPDQHVCWRGDAWEKGVLMIVAGFVPSAGDPAVQELPYVR